jgi:capsular exopolysaccharide synthesis family protein
MPNNVPMEPDGQKGEILPVVLGAAQSSALAALQPSDEEGAPVDFRRYRAALFRYKWLVVLGALAGVGAGFALTKVQKPKYMAQATIWIQQGKGGGTQTGPIQQGQLLESFAWQDLVRSYVVLDEVVRQMHLFLEAKLPSDSSALGSIQLRERFRPGEYRITVDGSGRNFVLSTSASEIQRGTVGDSVGLAVGFIWAPGPRVLRPGRTITFTVSTPRDAAVKLGQELQAETPLQGNFLRLSLVGNDPAFTAATLNAVAKRFVEVAADLKTEKLTELTKILGEQLQTVGDSLRRKEATLQSFRVGTITLPAERPPAVLAPGMELTQSDPLFQSFFTMKVDREAFRRDREAIQAVLASPSDSSDPVVALEGIGAVKSAGELMTALGDLTNKEAALRALRLRYTDDNPTVQRATAEVTLLRRQTVPTLARALMASIRTREKELDDRLGSTSRELRDIPPRAIEQERLSRDVTIAANLYTTLQSRYEEARLAEVSSIPDVRILDAAVPPEQPLRNVVPLLLGGGLAGGLGLAIVLAILLDHFDRRLRYPDQVTRGMGLAILGVVPRVPSGVGFRADAAAPVVDALRSIRLNLVHAYGTAGPLVTTITSPGSGDGKSFISSNLALTFADMGHKTLLIDGDIRRGSLHRVLKLNRKPGLIDYLAGQAGRDEIVQTSGIPSLDFIGSGTRKTGGPELLASGTMSQLLVSLRSSYSVIIMDSPPLGAGVDPLVLGTLTGSILMVFRSGVTDREMATVKLDHMARLPIRILGAILNDVKDDAVYKYYYSSYYLPGYESKDENEEQAGTAVKQVGSVR